MTVMIVERHRTMRRMIRDMIIHNVPNIDTICECVSGREAIEKFGQVRPDWILMDVRTEPVDGLTASKTILSTDADVGILIVTDYDDDAYRDAARNMGVHGYVLKENLRDVLGIIGRGPRKSRIGMQRRRKKSS